MSIPSSASISLLPAATTPGHEASLSGESAWKGGIANEANGTVLAQGGGIYAYQITVDMQNATVNGNQATGATAQGGGIYAYQSTVNMQNATVNGNDADGTVLGQGGEIFMDPSTVLALLNSTVEGNKATTSGNDIL